MSKLKDFLNTCRVFNNHELLLRFGAGKDVVVDYMPASLCVSVPGTSIYSPRFKTDRGSHWSSYGAKTFTGKRLQSMPRALAWAETEYGITEWAASPFGGRVPAHVVKAAQQAMKDAAAPT